MYIGDKEVLVVGDRILVKPDSSDERTKVGLYLPETVRQNQPVQSGLVMEVGPGIAVPHFSQDSSEPWKKSSEDSGLRFIPVQAQVGDHVLFLKKEAVEIQYLQDTYLVVPQSTILLVIRDDHATDIL